MPVATPEQYAEMLDRAKAGGFAYPAINASSSQTVNAVLQGLTEAGSDGIIQVTTGGADYFAGHTVKARATGALAFAEFATEVAKSYPITVALHTDHCPKPRSTDFVLPLIAGLRGGGQRPAATRSSSRTCGTARPCRSTRTSRSPRSSSRASRRSTPSSRSRSASSAAKRTASARRLERGLYTTVDDAIAGRRGARPRRERPLDGRPHLRQRARRLQARATSSSAPSSSARSRRASPRSSAPAEAARPRLPRRLRLDRRGDRRGGRERRREDEHRHRHAVRVHALGRRLHVPELRRRAEGRRRGGQQEGLRPARVGQGRRVGDGRARRRGHQQLGSAGKSLAAYNRRRFDPGGRGCPGHAAADGPGHPSFSPTVRRPGHLRARSS